MSRIKHQPISINKLNQDGMASILVVLIMSVVITLIVLGFAQVSTREQANALQTELSTTAYYAAESGINDAINIIKNNPNLPVSSYDKSTCGAPTSTTIYSNLYNSTSGLATFGINSNGTAGPTTYSCLLVNPAPTVITTDISSSSQVIPIDTDGKAISTLNFSWNTPNPNTEWSSLTCPKTSPQALPPPASWNCALGILRIDLVPIVEPISKSGLLTSTMSAFIIPNNGNTTNINFSANSNPNTSPISGSSCTNLGCKASIKIPINLSTDEFYLRVNSIYAGSNVLSLTATDQNGSSLPLVGAEYLIDSTGSSSGVLRRIQVAVPTIQPTNIPGYAIQTTNDICKRFYIIPQSAPGSSAEGIPHNNVTYFGITSTLDCSTEGY